MRRSGPSQLYQQPNTCSLTQQGSALWENSLHAWITIGYFKRLTPKGSPEPHMGDHVIFQAQGANRFFCDPTYSGLDLMRQSHPAWRLLRSEHAPLIASFLHRVFIVPNVRSMSQLDLAEALEDSDARCQPLVSWDIELRSFRFAARFYRCFDPDRRVKSSNRKLGREVKERRRSVRCS